MCIEPKVPAFGLPSSLALELVERAGLVLDDEVVLRVIAKWYRRVAAPGDQLVEDVSFG